MSPPFPPAIVVPFFPSTFRSKVLLRFSRTPTDQPTPIFDPINRTMSSPNDSPTNSAACNGNATAEAGKGPMAWGRTFNDTNEAGASSSAISGSDPQCSSSGDVLSRTATQNLNGNSSGNGTYRNRVQGGYGGRIDHRERLHEFKPPNSHRGLNGFRNGHVIPPYTQLPGGGEQPRPCIIMPQSMYSVPFIRNPGTFIWSPYQVPISYPAPYACYVGDAYPYPVYPAHIAHPPQVQYVGHPSHAYAAQKSQCSELLENLRAKVRKQIEYYFCPENLCTDSYLKQRMDVQGGWVPIALIAQFKRTANLMKDRQTIYDSFGLCDGMQVEIKQSTINEQFISDSLMPSDTVEVQGDKVRARHEWEKWILPRPAANPTAKSVDPSPATSTTL